jgi:CRP-like cAMP-binding protein
MQLERLELLRNTAVFAGIKEDTLTQLLNESNPFDVEKGKYFFHEGESGHSMYILEKGTAAILKPWEGHEYLLRESGPGDCFGEMSLLDLSGRSASVRALEDCSAIEIPSAVLNHVFNSDPYDFAMIHMNMGREVSRRLREANQRLFESKVDIGEVDGNLHLT